MSENNLEALRNKIVSLATESLKNNDATGWFETVYTDAEGDTSQVPWARSQPHPYLQDWLEKYPPKTDGKTAIVIGCGLGDDAEALAKLGFKVTAFDISPTAISWCHQRFPNTTVNYFVGDLFNLDSSLQHSFDFVFECRTIQALPLNMRSDSIQAISSLVAEKGTLIVITRYRDSENEPDGPPWPLSEGELSQFKQLGLEEIRRDRFIEEDKPGVVQFRLQYQRL
ncbi:MAG: methyltransferase domain-containing protein [Limnoraphis robusta]|uniref:Thiopurine S-methyltransferase n=1 Tax=Limnoraphis robusta CS-951 TaxID=1637645 RepID=A0A0F5YHH1_9CYAN|nr:methyltransferase domain-containing protein [Limnoraphis robusta]KKD38203.1 thiopurine S-methyltransferase [Limnoraphis robusta CS-951]